MSLVFMDYLTLASVKTKVGGFMYSILDQQACTFDNHKLDKGKFDFQFDCW